MPAQTQEDKFSKSVINALKDHHDLKNGRDYQIVSQKKGGGRVVVTLTPKTKWVTEYNVTINTVASKNGFSYEIK